MSRRATKSPQPPQPATRPSSVQRRLILVVGALALAIAGCSAGSTGQGTSDRGTVLGSFMQVGGPGLLVDGRLVTQRFPLPGQVVARGQTGSTFTVTVGKSGHFRMLLPPGTYRLTGYSPMYPGPCAGENAIKVRTGKHVTHINVICVAA